MSKYTLGKLYHYWVEILDANDDRICPPKQVFKRPKDLDEWCLNRFVQLENAYRVQVWIGTADPDNPNPDTEWVNTYCREPFTEFGQTSLKINRSTKSTRVTAKGDRFISETSLPPVYALPGNWYKVTQKGNKKKRKKLDLEAIA